MDNDDGYVIGVLDFLKLPVGEGFWNNGTIVFEKKLWGVQNVGNRDERMDCLEDCRKVVVFDEWKWEVVE